MSHIFLSYRRQDSADVTGRIHDALATHFGRESVFMDVDDIPLGADFPKHIEEVLGACSSVLVTIGPRWLNITGDDGLRRLDAPRDFVRIEVETALRLDKPVVPLLVGGATMPAKSELPPSIASLADRSGMPVRADPDFRRDIDQLTRHLEQWVEPVPQPTGALTFLFTDIEGSTELWDAQREAMSRALVRHDQILREAIEDRGGDVFKTVGDAFCAAFTDADGALQAALHAQRALAAEDWARLSSDFADLKVRMGLHTGPAEARGGDYFGPALNRTARLMSAGHGGQILISLATQQVVRDIVPSGVTLQDRGEHRLRDLRHSEHIWQVLAPELPEVEAPLKTADRPGPSERVFVDETGTERSLADTLSALLGAVRSDDREVTLDPAEVRQVLESRPADLSEYHLARIAEWSQPRYRLDGRFVELTLLVDQGEEAVTGRWQAKDERYNDLGVLLANVTDPAVVVLGPPGCGKSTLLRYLDLETAIGNLRGEESRDTVTFFIQLNQYAPDRPGQPLPAPGEWLAERWAARFPALPPLQDLLDQGRMVLLLDALNEMPAGSEREMHEHVQLWKGWLQQVVADQPGNRIVFSCRTLDYSAPLSTPTLRVPQVRIEPLSDEQIVEFLQLYSPARWRETWEALEGSRHLEVVRSPYFLSLLAEQVEATGEIPTDRAALFTGFVRRALQREVERGNALFAPGLVLDARDLRRVSGARRKWKTPFDLPERGPLVPKLAALAHAMQQRAADGERSQVRADLDEALAMLDHPDDEAIVAAGEALAVLDEDLAAEALMYVHQLVQEYFAARVLAARPNPELVRSEWRAAEVAPSVDEVIDSLAPADALPRLPQTRWEETTALAAAMTADPAAFVRGVSEVNLALAGRIAAQPEVGERLPEALVDELRWALVNRSRDPEADLRDRIACGFALGDLGDPRYELRQGPHGPYLMPPLIEIPGGTYPIGDDEPIEWIFARTGESGTETGHMPRHEVAIAAFRIGQFPVTNAEWRSFMDSGAYDDERWWRTPDAKRWQHGELANEGGKYNNRLWRRRFKEDPGLFDRMVEEGLFDSEETIERARSWNELDDEAFERALDDHWQPKRRTEPHFWQNERYNGTSQPVVGICWYEARAYCNWLAAQIGLGIRLPTEAEWEAAARGQEARAYPWGDEFDRLKANTYETHVRATTPGGVFPEGDTPQGVADVAGNVYEWTSSLWGEYSSEEAEVECEYPYDPADGREDEQAPPSVARVARGGSWYSYYADPRAANRLNGQPGSRSYSSGLRLALPPT